MINKNTLSNAENDKDMGVIIDSRLLKLANSMIAIIKKGFLNLTEETMATLQNLGETASEIRQSIVKPIPGKKTK